MKSFINTKKRAFNVFYGLIESVNDVKFFFSYEESEIEHLNEKCRM